MNLVTCLKILSLVNQKEEKKSLSSFNSNTSEMCLSEERKKKGESNAALDQTPVKPSDCDMLCHRAFEETAYESPQQDTPPHTIKKKKKERKKLGPSTRLACHLFIYLFLVFSPLGAKLEF